MIQSESIDELATALAAAQGEFQTIDNAKPVNTGVFTFAYATLASVLESVRPILAKHGLSVIQAPARVQGGVEVTTTLAHKSGQWFSSTLGMPGGKGDAQGLGGGITYARRYALCAILGLATEDDNGKAASEAPTRSQRAPSKPPLPESNKPKLLLAFRGLGIEPPILERHLGHSVENISDEEAETLTTYGQAIRAGNEEAREELCGPTPAKRMAEELGADAE